MFVCWNYEWSFVHKHNTTPSTEHNTLRFSSDNICSSKMPLTHTFPRREDPCGTSSLSAVLSCRNSCGTRDDSQNLAPTGAHMQIELTTAHKNRALSPPPAAIAFRSNGGKFPLSLTLSAALGQMSAAIHQPIAARRMPPFVSIPDAKRRG